MTKLTAILLVLGVLVGAAAGSYIGTWLATKSLRAGTINQGNNQMTPPMQPQPMTPGQGSQLPQPSQGQTMLNQPMQNQPNQNQPLVGTGQQ